MTVQVERGVGGAADLLFVKNFSLVTSRTLPPACRALLREAWATSSLPRRVGGRAEPRGCRGLE
ncbi:hypothetical protein EYF80_049636 [Liparis tanakae]|uniref:Uncharacterized protein n=1 Tax=Liparis tanakae TaxID=230148 RepID=A0A4Z2FGA2_9TELE|nr:hypothetical protein EYF80_049636 [Liparis tanakae]